MAVQDGDLPVDVAALFPRVAMREWRSPRLRYFAPGWIRGLTSHAVIHFSPVRS